MNDHAETRPRGRSRILAVALALILLVTFSPVISVLIASAISGAAGCALNEASASSCIVLGAEMGGLLNRMFVAGWYMFFTFPAGVLALSVWTVFLLMSIQRGR
jgi:hypothetical protein